MTQKVLFLMDCGHVLLLPVTVTESACPNCLSSRRDSVAVDVVTNEWHVRCRHRKCTFSRWRGTAEFLARIDAVKHYAVHHEVYVALEANPVAVKHRAKFYGRENAGIPNDL